LISASRDSGSWEGQAVITGNGMGERIQRSCDMKL